MRTHVFSAPDLDVVGVAIKIKFLPGGEAKLIGGHSIHEALQHGLKDHLARDVIHASGKVVDFELERVDLGHDA